MMPMGFDSISIGILLMAMAAGYIVCYLANREEKTLRKIGYIIGIFIILAAGLLILSKLAGRIGSCGMPQPMMPGKHHQMMMREQAPLQPPVKP